MDLSSETSLSFTEFWNSQNGKLLPLFLVSGAFFLTLLLAGIEICRAPVSQTRHYTISTTTRVTTGAGRRLGDTGVIDGSESITRGILVDGKDDSSPGDRGRSVGAWSDGEATRQMVRFDFDLQ